MYSSFFILLINKYLNKATLKELIMVIVDKIIDVIAKVAEEKTDGFVEKYKLKRFIEELENRIQVNFIYKYESEEYFSNLDRFLFYINYYETIIRICFGKTNDVSLNNQNKIFVNKFINAYPKHKPISCRIEETISYLTNQIYDGLLNSKVIDTNNALYIRMQDKMNVLLERMTNVDENTLAIMSQLNQLTFQVTKALNPNEIRENSYKDLHMIYTDKSYTFIEKEIEYIKWIDKNSDCKEGLIWIADNCKKNNDLKRAEHYYKYIVENYENEFELNNNLGLIYLELNQTQLARKHFKKVLKYDNKNINALYNLTTSYYYEGHNNNFNTSLKYIKAAFEVNPLDADVVSLYASILSEMQPNNCGYAIKILHNALKKSPNDYYLNVNLGFAYLFQKKFKEAIELLENLNRDYPRHILCVSLLGMTYGMKGVEKKDKAIILFEEAYDLTKEQGYLNNISILKQGLFFDTIIYNCTLFNIYSDDELWEYNNLKQVVEY